MRKRILITFMVITMLFGLFGCKGKEEKTVVSAESMTLTLQGMRGTFIYEIAKEADRTELRYYRQLYLQGEDVLELEKSAACEIEEIIELMNTCSVIRWDGFHGKHPKNVWDGIMFRFTAVVNGGQTLNADGSANFPKGYHEFVRALNLILDR